MKIADEIKQERALSDAVAESKRWKSKYNAVTQELKESNKRVDFLKSINKPVREHNLTKVKASGQSTAVLVVSDIHAEETIDPLTINGLNEFTLDICKTRVENIFRRSLMMIDMARGMSKIDSLVIALLGDNISGYIHDELEENNSLSPTEATLFVSDLLVNGIKFLKKEGRFKSIVIPTCYGNHGRTTKKKRCSSGYANSYEWLMYKNLEKYAQIPGVQWKTENGYFNWLNIQGHEVRFSHGDNMMYLGGVGGITIAVNKAIAQWNKVHTATYDFFGHFHTFMNTPRWCCNGSVIGYGPYSLSIKAEFEVPSQTISIIDRTRGKILTDRVFCD